MLSVGRSPCPASHAESSRTSLRSSSCIQNCTGLPIRLFAFFSAGADLAAAPVRRLFRLRTLCRSGFRLRFCRCCVCWLPLDCGKQIVHLVLLFTHTVDTVLSVEST